MTNPSAPSAPVTAPDALRPTIGELFDIPRQVHQGDFVIKLTEGASSERASETLRDYVVTPQLAESFDAALKLVQGSLSTRASRAAYLHGSFGAGKSHFMAVLTHLLDGTANARAIPELAEVVSGHGDWLPNRRVLVVPLYMLGARSLESAVFSQYARFVRIRHPEAPTPGFYTSELLFENARLMRATMGDEVFFGTLNGAAGGAGGWGALGAGWDADSFEAAMVMEPEDPERARLVGALVDVFFRQMVTLAGSASESFVDIGQGLVVLAEHARSLGYDGVVLFLDEVMLWLASNAADQEFLSREAQKLVALVETADMHRAIPIVSFLARQRDLRELVGTHLAGSEQQAISDVLQYWEGRFGTVRLEDRNLPMIIEKRLLRPKDAVARQRIEEAYAATATIRQEVLQVLLTREGDREQFKRVFPFSPVLVQALVALSSMLQRERTALKLLVELLVKQRDTLQLGDVMPVGELWEVLATGTDHPIGAVARERFDLARRFWDNKLVPMLQDERQAMLAQGAPEAAADLAYRNDRRLLATLVLGALAEGVEALTALTPQKLVALNHGSVRSRIPGQESRQVLEKLQRWSMVVGELRLADSGTTSVASLQLTGVDYESIIRNAMAADSPGARKQRIRSILFEAAGINAVDALTLPLRAVPWRGTQRQVEVLFTNVREMPPEQFRRSGEAEWRLVFDYPFDVPGQTPADDRAAVQHAIAEEMDEQTIVWLPSFLTPAAQGELGRLVVIEHLLSGTQLDAHATSLSANDRVLARQQLENLRSALRTNLQNALLAAYGLTEQFKDRLDEGCLLDQHLYTLASGLQLQRPPSATLREAVDHVVGQALAFVYPVHPEFTGDAKPGALRLVWQVVQRATQDPGGRVEVDRAHREEMRRFAVPLQLGAMGDAHFVLERYWVTHFQQCQARGDGAPLTVERVRRWLDEPRARGLPKLAQNLVILTWALQTNRTFHLYGSTPVAQENLDSLNDALEIRERTLPDAAAWGLAVQRAGEVLGITVPPMRSAQALDILGREVQQRVSARLQGSVDYVRELDAALARVMVDREDSQRYRSAVAGRNLLSALHEQPADTVVRTLAELSIPTTAAAVGQAIGKGAELGRLLGSATWNQVGLLGNVSRELFGIRVQGVLDRLCEALRMDEHAAPLATALDVFERDANQIVNEALALAARPAPPRVDPNPIITGPVDPDPVVPPPEPVGGGRGTWRGDVQSLDQALDAVRESITSHGAGMTVEITWKMVPPA